MVLWLLLSMNMLAVDVAHTEFEWRGWMLLSMNMHGVDVALNEFAWFGLVDLYFICVWGLRIC